MDVHYIIRKFLGSVISFQELFHSRNIICSTTLKTSSRLFDPAGDLTPNVPTSKPGKFLAIK